MDGELTERISLLDQRGRLSRSGWAADDFFDFNVENIRSRRGFAEWERYRVMNRRFVLDIFYGHTGSMGRVGGVLQDLEIGEKTVFGGLRPGAGDRFDLDFTASMPHNLKYEDDKCFLSVGCDGDCRELRLRGESFHAELFAHNEGDALVTAVPLGGTRTFALNYKKTFSDLAGHISFRNRDYDMDTETFLNLWSHRGVWPLQGEWYRCHGAAECGGHLIALELLWGCAEEGATPESALFMDGRICRLGAVRCRTGELAEGKELYISDASGRVHLCFTPESTDRERIRRLSFGCRAHTLYGTVSGTVVTEDNETRSVDGMCFALEHANTRW